MWVLEILFDLVLFYSTPTKTDWGTERRTDRQRDRQTDGLSSRMSMHPLRSPTKNLFCFSRLCLPFLLLLLVFYFSRRRRRRRRRWWLALNNDDKRAELHRTLSTCEYIRIYILTLRLGLSLSSIHLPVVLFLIIDLLWHLFCLYLVFFARIRRQVHEKSSRSTKDTLTESGRGKASVSQPHADTFEAHACPFWCCCHQFNSNNRNRNNNSNSKRNKNKTRHSLRLVVVRFVLIICLLPNPPTPSTTHWFPLDCPSSAAVAAAASFHSHSHSQSRSQFFSFSRRVFVVVRKILFRSSGFWFNTKHQTTTTTSKQAMENILMMRRQCNSDKKKNNNKRFLTCLVASHFGEFPHSLSLSLSHSLSLCQSPLICNATIRLINSGNIDRQHQSIVSNINSSSICRTHPKASSTTCDIHLERGSSKEERGDCQTRRPTDRQTDQKADKALDKLPMGLFPISMR